MKKYIWWAVCAVLLLSVLAVINVKAGPASTPSVVFNEKPFYLQYSDGSAALWINEYLPAGATFDNYTEMIALRSYDGTSAEWTPMDLANAIGKNYEKEYPNTKYLLLNNPKTGEGIVDFIMATDSIFEHNLFRTTRGNNGVLVSLQHVYRMYPPKAGEARAAAMKTFSATVKSNREAWLNMLGAMPVPAVVRTKK